MSGVSEHPDHLPCRVARTVAAHLSADALALAYTWRLIVAEGFRLGGGMRTSRDALAPGFYPRIMVGEWGARDPAQFALAGSDLPRRSAAIRWRQLLWTSLGASRSRVSARQLLTSCLVRFDDRPAASYSTGRAYPYDQPTSDVPLSLTSTASRLQSAKSAHRSNRYRSLGFHP